jgi:hypothetical protein
MLQKNVVRLLTLACVVGGLWVILGTSDSGRGLLAAPGDKKDTKDEKKAKKRGGTVVGTLTKKGDSFIEVKADGEEKARRYVPRWVGGAPAQGGGPDKKLLKAFKGLKVGSRVRLEWEFDERPRVLRVEVLKKADDEKQKSAGGEKK